MKKVLLVATVQSHIAQFHKPLMHLLKQNNYEIHVAARDNLEEKNGLQIEHCDKIFDINFSRSPFDLKNIHAYRVLKRIIHDNDYDVVHCNTPVGGILSRLACKKFRKDGLKVFYTVHGFHFYKGASALSWVIYYPIEKIFSKITDKLITISNEDYEMAKKKNFKCEVHRIHSVGANHKKYYAVDSETMQKLRTQHGYNKDDYICLCAGELLPNKNQSTLIKATKHIVKDIPNFKLLLAGNGYMDKPLQDLIDELDLNNNIKLIGYRTDLEQFMNLSDFVASASIREGLGLNLIEAMLCKKPVIGSKNRGHNELIKEGNNGYTFNALNEKELYEKVIKIYTEKEKYKSLCENALIVAEPYTRKSVSYELEKIYQL